jgi:hypothetical protein
MGAIALAACYRSLYHLTVTLCLRLSCTQCFSQLHLDCVHASTLFVPQNVNDAGRLRMPAAAALAHLDDPAEQPPPPPPDMRQLMACAVEISDAMRYLHSRGMMHGAQLLVQVQGFCVDA